MIEAAEELGVERSVIVRLIKAGCLPATQICKHAPWVIKRQDLYSIAVQNAIGSGKLRIPCAENHNQLPLEFQ